MRGRAGALRLESAIEGENTADAPAPSIVAYADELAEARGVATRIRARIDEGAPPESIAVLMRVNSQSALLERALDDVGVGSRVRGAARFFDQPEVREAVHALRAAALTIAGEPLFKSVSDVLRSLGWSVQPPGGARRGAQPVGVAQRDRTPRRRCARGHDVPAVRR